VFINVYFEISGSMLSFVNIENSLTTASMLIKVNVFDFLHVEEC